MQKRTQRNKAQRIRKQRFSKLTLTPLGKLILVAILIIAIIVGIILIIFGGGYKPDKSGIFVYSDGTILVAEVTDFDNSQFEEDRYDDDELEDFVDEAIDNFNGSNATDEISKPVSLKRLSTSSDKATLILKFAKPEFVTKFYGTLDTCPVKLIDVCKVSEGSEEAFSGMVDMSGEEANVSDIKENDDYTLVKIIGDTEIECDGDIVYRSSNVEVVEGKERTVAIANDDKGYIIFK